jgi:hypothetical protein
MQPYIVREVQIAAWRQPEDINQTEKRALITPTNITAIRRAAAYLTDRRLDFIPKANILAPGHERALSARDNPSEWGRRPVFC